MNEIVSNLLVYGSLPEDSILWQLADICEKLKDGTETKAALRGRVFHQVKNLLTVATDYAFDKNLWHNYLTFLLITNENPFSLVCEKMGAQEGTVNNFVTHDFDMFKELFDYDFSWLEKELSIDCFTQLTHYQAIRIAENKDGSIRFLPINNMDTVMLDDLIGYELQKKKLVENTQAFCDGKAANNVLLFGDSGTGKSTSIKAIVNQFYPQGLRMIEIYKHQFKDLSTIIAQIKNRNYKFIIYMDDLSFEEFEIEYKFLKAVIEGGVETKPDNVLIYATSNRRHLIKETWKDREDMEHSEDLHRSDTMEEKLSLVNRFGLSIFYAKPNKEGFNEMAVALARRAGITPEVMTDEEICYEANRFEMRGGGLSGRTAQQFANYLLTIK